MPEITLKCGSVILVDEQDVALVQSRPWYLGGGRDGRTYVVTCGRRRNAEPGTLWLHREILGCPPEFEGDHINRNPLDNRRANLRIATRSQNCQWAGPQRETSSRYKGVSYVKSREKWLAQISVNGKRRNLGRYPDELIAAKVYDVAAREAFGEFAYLNFPSEVAP